MQLAIQTTEILAQIHQKKVIHKDLSPSNIIVVPPATTPYKSNQWQAKIIDFGASTVLSQEQPNLQQPQKLAGTLAYIAPEQTGRINRMIDYRSDLYSLGICLYELFTKQLPFQAKDPLELVHAHIAKHLFHPIISKQHCPNLFRKLSSSCWLKM